jgi:predicted enzyme related to lactoylglutathione lyase
MNLGRLSPVVHLELHTHDLPGARAFYTELCGWSPHSIHTPHGSYIGLELGGELGGGMVGCATAHALWLPYVEVENITAATERAQALGAGVLLAPREGPSGWRSVIATRAGGELALWQHKR